MSERLPYEDHLQQHWVDFPLPDENKAWEDMRRRLEEDDDDRPIIAWWRRGCLLWGLLLLVIFGSGLWLIRKKYFTAGDKKEVTGTNNNETPDKKRNDTVIIQTIPSSTGATSGQESKIGETRPIKKITGRQQTRPGDNLTTVNDTGIERASITSADYKRLKVKKGAGIQNPAVTGRRNRRNVITENNDKNISNPVVTGKRKNIKSASRKPVAGPLKPAKNNTDKNNNVPAQPVSNDKGSVRINNSIISKRIDTTGVKPANDIAVVKAPDKKDSVVTIKTGKQDTLGTNTAKNDSTKKKHLSYSGGISMQQLLPVAGQKTVPYNSQGRKGTLADYIPSIYFRVNKEQKWFIQGEFKYGAPQYTREFVYKQERREDTLSPTLTFTTRTSNTLKKTYYHQLPVTFNYFLTKEWSVGAGFSWNKFVSAISDQEVTRRDNSTTIDSVISKGIVREKQNSATGFAKSYLQGVFESQYKWKRFSFGARYSFGLQPYLKFTLLNGETGKESNRSLQIFLRYELWKSKKK